MFDRRRIGLMKPGAILVNIGRGPVVEEDALIDALRSGRLRGAALDVFETEPLPRDSPLWDLDNVILSPHTAAQSIHENERIVELFAENLRRYLAGEELRSRIRTDLFY
jgi:phosphoglycerate dehydrogenase-like enzyme